MLTLQGQRKAFPWRVVLCAPPEVRTKALSCLQRVAPKGPGVEGSRYDIRTARKDDRPHIRQP